MTSLPSIMAWSLVLSAYFLFLPLVSAVHTPVTISVERGRVTYLRPEDLFPDPPPEGAVCKVEVVSHDPITMRVGRFEPSVSTVGFLFVCVCGRERGGGG